MRIIGGSYKGKRLEAPANNDIRPTSDRTREALFNLLMHMHPNPVIDQRVMDLCCGTGALGLEAISRGAAHGTFVDNNQTALGLTEKNVRHLGVLSQTKLIQANASSLPRATEAVQLVMMDPPYQHETIVESAYQSLRTQGWIEAGSLLYIEQSKKKDTPVLEGTDILRQRRYGKSEIVILEVL